MDSAIILAFIMCFAFQCYTCVYIKPEQIHLSYGEDPTYMVVKWSTSNASMSSTGMIALKSAGVKPNKAVQGRSEQFVDPGTAHHTQYIHTVTFSGLSPGSEYVYQVGSLTEDVWSQVYTFRAMRSGSDWSPSVALYGDFGLSNHQSLQRLTLDKEKGMYDAILHVGDFAYDMDSDNGYTGDKFMNMVEPLASELPYMTCPGNHENKYNFTHYKRRFSMPSDENGDLMFYSFNMGPVHFISLSTEYYFFIQYGLVQALRQYYWLLDDLKEANKPENRKQRPWIIAYGHRPMYCSNTDKDDCTKHHSIVRDGIPVIHKYGLEQMFYDYGVDLAIWAHEHSYERLWPVFDDKVYNGSKTEPYTNPKAPVHIITGSAGCQENHDPFIPDPRPWSAFRSDDYGYTRMKVFNSSHLYLEQVSDDKGGAVIDKIWIKKDSHGRFH
ncbi:acid phosphatase type 7-like [Mya arenaria]|uniref:acid phosphatase type 7-like n=1 Tax=Mya arenaria TaxID=6604 RepID=UPI0022E6D310|nr:acid phosphatase type 7-like [Mya arenaria]